MNAEEAKKTVERTDRFMDLLLVILSILAASLFQYTCTSLSLSERPVEEIFDLMSYNLRLLFAPILMSAGLWLANRAFVETIFSKSQWIQGIQIAFKNASFSLMLFALVGQADVFVEIAQLQIRGRDLFWPILVVIALITATYLGYRHIIAVEILNSGPKKEVQGRAERMTKVSQAFVIAFGIFIFYQELVWKFVQDAPL